MNAILLTAALAIGQTSPPQNQATPPQGQNRPADQNQMAAGIEGTWTVVCLEKNGQPVPEAARMTVTVRNNVATFSGGDEKNKQKAMRIEFAPNGMVKVTEMDDANRTGTDAKADPNRPAQKDATNRDAGEAKSGVYVLAKEYFCLCLHDKSGTGGRTDGGRTDGQQGTNQQGTTGQQGGQGGTGGQANQVQPEGKASCVVILKRSGSGTGTDRR